MTLQITKAATARRLRECRGLKGSELIHIFARRLCDLPVGVLYATGIMFPHTLLQMYKKHVVIVRLLLSVSVSFHHVSADRPV